MKKTILIAALCWLAYSPAFAQAEVHLLINHRLGSSTFDPNLATSNNLGDPFTIDRLDYYIAEITLYHDGGQETKVDNHYVLVKTAEELSLRTDSLGIFQITQLDSIRFGIGVDGDQNHQDISAFPPDHPLFHQNPSMHWGWAAGYRFVAIEGLAGAATNQVWQVHALGDNNYGFATVVTAGNWDANVLTIAIDGDYQKALKDIPVDGSLLYHGTSSSATSILNNFQTEVFSPGSGSLRLLENASLEWGIYPNPSNGQISLNLSQDLEGISVEIKDLSGRVIYWQDLGIEPSTSIEIKEAGVYLVSLYQGQQLIGTQRLINR